MAEDSQPIASSKPLAEYYGQQYYAHYSHNSDSPYQRGEPAWTQFFGEIARQVAADLRPSSVLDAGCAIGLLVEALRDRGVEAWGMDSSTYAIGQVRQDIRQFCWVGSIADDFDRDYDLITCIEVLEHLPPHEADQAVANFARHTERVLLSSTPDDYREPTHLNVQPTDYWVGMFARHGLFRDLDFDAYFVSGHAILFRRESGTPVGALRAYERRYWQLATERRELRAAVLAATDAQASQAGEIEHLQTERRLLSGEVNYWEWQTGIAQAALEPARAELDVARAALAQATAELDSLRARAISAQSQPPRVGLFERFERFIVSIVGRLQRDARTSSRRGSRQAADAAEPIVEAADGPREEPIAEAADGPREESAPQPPGTTPARVSPHAAKKVLFISDGADGSRRYRCDHQAEALERSGWSADVIVYEDRPLTHVLASYDAFVVDRLPLRPNLESLFQIAHQLGKPLVYDTDDLIFDPKFAESWGPFAGMSAENRQSLEHGMWRNGQALRCADAVLVSTEPLRRYAADLHARVFVSPNAISQAMLAAADAALATARPAQAGDAITLAYLSGTPTHQRDFAQAADAVRSILAEYAHTRLLIVGLLDLPADFQAFGDRIERLDLQPWQALPSVLARVTINLAPLEPGNPFTDGKSCVKYLEAGLLRVPTIASPRPDFTRVIRQNYNGMLADSADAWTSALRTLVESAATRAELGEQARQDVCLQHTTASRGQYLTDVLHELLLERS